MNEHPSPADIVGEAIERYKPVAIYAGFSGGNGSRPLVHWAMNNVPGCEVMHLNTGVGVEASRQWVRDTCKAYGWRLNEIHTSESYDDLVRQYGFPGPDGHRLMYQRLKERAVWELLRRAKKGHPRSAKVLILTGIRHAAARAAIASAESTPAAAPESAQAVAHCALTPAGKVAYFDGKPMLMVGPVGNEHHPTPLYTHPAPARVAVALTPDQRKAIGQWLDMGNNSLGLAHQGYFSRGGWAYETLAGLTAPEESGR